GQVLVRRRKGGCLGRRPPLFILEGKRPRCIGPREPLRGSRLEVLVHPNNGLPLHQFASFARLFFGQRPAGSSSPRRRAAWISNSCAYQIRAAIDLSRSVFPGPGPSSRAWFPLRGNLDRSEILPCFAILTTKSCMLKISPTGRALVR